MVLTTICLKVMVGAQHILLHRIVCEAFHGAPPTLTSTVNHIDRNRLNNPMVNLRWAESILQGANMSSNRSVAAFEVGSMSPKGIWNI